MSITSFDVYRANLLTAEHHGALELCVLDAINSFRADGNTDAAVLKWLLENVNTPEQVRAFVDGHGENIAAMGSVSTLEGAFATGTQNTVLSAVKDYVVQYVVALKKAGLLA
jgi:hypothetical protein